MAKQVLLHLLQAPVTTWCESTFFTTIILQLRIFPYLFSVFIQKNVVCQYLV